MLHEFEEFLTADECTASAYVDYLKKLGGNTYQEFISRSLKHTISYAFGTKCSWLGLRNNIKVCHYKFMKLIKGYLQLIVKKQNLLLNMVSRVIRDVSQIKIKTVGGIDTSVIEGDADSIFAKYRLPIDCEADLQNFEDALQNVADFNKILTEISTFGGRNTYDFIYRATQRIITNRFSADFSWLGRKGKRVFKNLHLASLLTKAAMKTSNCTAMDAELSVNKWLRRCAERARNEKKI
ncbi:uncharacterized protein LOC116173730 isoform X2 [Photinus pyralis]|uniref:uncharacterized protein LOC116173730 isoform X2 n=1 Tax=Photinus pyralis TaxID=7054 RepID=UPI0012673C51|nr:uncharacterized protein LOC116173730 isoform X2 [Photinus pyralis]